MAVLDSAPELAKSDWEGLVNIAPHLIIDFDQSTDSSGGFFMGGPELAKLRSLRLCALDENVRLSSAATSVWVAGSGLASRPSTIQSKTWREWNRTKARRLAQVVSEVARVTEPEPATIMVFGGESSYVLSVCELIDQYFADRAEFVFATLDLDAYADTAERFDGSTVPIRLTEVCHNIRELFRTGVAAAETEVPQLDGGSQVVESDRARWVEEELDIVHLGVGLSSDDPVQERRDFLRGFQVSWFGLNTGVDINRTTTQRLERIVRTELESRATRRVNLWHWPGAGGTTAARRIAWNLHTEYPTVVAKSVEPVSSAERIQYLFSLTRQPVLVIVDSPTATRDNMDRLYDQIRGANVPAVLLQVGRHLGRQSRRPEPFLDAMLSTTEAVSIADALSREVPDRRAAFELLVDVDDRRRRSAFYFGLTAFGRDFAGLEEYITSRLDACSESVKIVCRLSSLAYHYGQSSVPVQLFASILRLPAKKTVRASIMLPDYITDLFVESNGSLRPAHELIAEELLQQQLGAAIGDVRNWRSGLADAAIEFIECCAEQPHLHGGTVSELVRAVFIERRAEETPAGPWEGEFSQLVSDIPSTEARERVLETTHNVVPG